MNLNKVKCLKDHVMEELLINPYNSEDEVPKCDDN